jgi:hypothetical protein
VPKFGGIGGWAPGQTAQFLPPGAGWLLPQDADFIIQTHYHRDGKPAADQTRVGLYFAKGPVEQPWQTVILAGLKPWDRIPAGKANHVARGSVYLHTDAVLHSVIPHMHLLGKSVKVTLTPPGGTELVLVDIPRWDYNWQETYWFKDPIPAAAGTRLTIEAVFDNSAANPHSPSGGTKDVFVGEETTDEMLYAFFGATSTKTPFERVRFQPHPPGASGAAAVDPARGQMTPVLERRVGTWETETVIKPGGLVSKELRLRRTEVVEKAHGGRFVRGSAKSLAENSELTTLATYVPAAEQYRLWLFASHGMNLEWTGAWDEDRQVMTWTASPQEGVTARLHWRFLSDDRFEWDLKAESAGKVVLDMAGTMTRKK